jgi:hypothetical protein
MKLLRALTVAALAAQTVALTIGGKHMKVERDSDGKQDLVSSCPEARTACRTSIILDDLVLIV